MGEFLSQHSYMWPLLAGLLAVVSFVAAVIASAHAIMYRRDTRGTIAWVGLIWLSPLIGSILYYCLGINRIRRRGAALGIGEAWTRDASDYEHEVGQFPFTGASEKGFELESLVNLVESLTGRSLLPGNRVVPLFGGDETYPAMLEAIDQAQRSITLCSYIFDYDRVGREFSNHLVRAQKRGVQVRVLIDAAGARYSRPTMVSELRAVGLPAEGFLPTRLPGRFHFANLRNHRKIAIVDGRVGFTGGTNIREGHQLSLNPSHPVQDVHFRLDGPVVAHLQETFAIDWAFTTNERLHGDAWFPPIPTSGTTWARGVPDGPDEDFEKLPLTIHGALTAARSEIFVVTPYFLPEATLITALNVAAMRGVEVNIVLPKQNNIRLVQWASTALLWQLLARGCRIWLSPPPFDHTKLLLVDGAWTLLGSTNWDPRSLRLNFEFNVECYNRDLASQLTNVVKTKIETSREVTLAEVDRRSIPTRLRDGAARLFSPYL